MLARSHRTPAERGREEDESKEGKAGKKGVTLNFCYVLATFELTIRGRVFGAASEEENGGGERRKKGCLFSRFSFRPSLNSSRRSMRSEDKRRRGKKKKRNLSNFSARVPPMSGHLKLLIEKEKTSPPTSGAWGEGGEKLGLQVRTHSLGCWVFRKGGGGGGGEGEEGKTVYIYQLFACFLFVNSR